MAKQQRSSTCCGPEARRFQLHVVWVINTQEAHHVNALWATKKEKEEMTLFGKFVTQGNERGGEIGKLWSSFERQKKSGAGG